MIAQLAFNVLPCYFRRMAKHTVSTVEARRTLSELLLAVQFKGERVTITRNGRAVAELVPVAVEAPRRKRQVVAVEQAAVPAEVDGQ